MTETVGTEALSPTKQEMEALCGRVARDLPDIDSMSDEDLAVVLLTYDRLIRYNFVPWMTYTWIRCQSDVAEKACRDNLNCEVNKKHPWMLADFVAPARRYTSIKEKAFHRANLGRNLVAGLDFAIVIDDEAINGLLVMACLENASIAFIPWLAEAGRRIGATDFTYTDVHGEADIDHANEFVNAVDAERSTLGMEHIHHTRVNSNPIELVEKFLHYIFHAHEAA